VRSTDGKTRTEVLRRIKKTAEALGSLHDARIEVNVLEGYPPVVNHPEGYRIAREAAESVLGKEKVINLKKPSMGGEDFAYYLHRVPGCFVRFGGMGKDVVVPTAHSSCFNFDENAILVGAAFMADVVQRAIADKRKERAKY
jgi:hippurate hydrolase